MPPSKVSLQNVCVAFLSGGGGGGVIRCFTFYFNFTKDAITNCIYIPLTLPQKWNADIILEKKVISWRYFFKGLNCLIFFNYRDKYFFSSYYPFIQRGTDFNIFFLLDKCFIFLLSSLLQSQNYIKNIFIKVTTMLYKIAKNVFCSEFTGSFKGKEPITSKSSLYKSPYTM